MEEKNKTKIYNLVILDKSGSMQSIRKEAVDGFNETLGSIKATQLKLLDTQEHYVSLAAFCGCGIDMIYDMTPIKDADRLDMKQYSPCCHTPLYDAIGKTVNAIKKKTAEVEGAAVLVTIITDGFENSSQEWDAKGVASLIDECKEEGTGIKERGLSWFIAKVPHTYDCDITGMYYLDKNVVIYAEVYITTYSTLGDTSSKDKSDMKKYILKNHSEMREFVMELFS